jgi:hypothetical protein
MTIQMLHRSGTAVKARHDGPVTPQRFPIRFSPGNRRALGFLGIRPANSYVEVGDAVVTVRMGWGYRAAIPRSAIRSAATAPDVTRMATGAHGLRGRWLINAAYTGIVRVEVDPPARGWTLVIPVRLRELRVSVEDPEGLVRALSPAG